MSSFDGRASFILSADKLAQFDGYPLVVAVVAYDEPTEQVQQYASYALTVNGVLQPGGRGGPARTGNASRGTRPLCVSGQP